MKIFGKRKKATILNNNEKNIDITIPKDEDTTIKSYFDEGAQDQRLNLRQVQEDTGKGNGEISSKKKLETDIAVLLSMDPKMLNSKQRRLLRREEERQKQESTQSPPKSNNEENEMQDYEKEKKEITDQLHSTIKTEENKSTEEHKSTEEASTTNEKKNKTLEIPAVPSRPKLEGLNSKDRRRALRQYEQQLEQIGLIETCQENDTPDIHKNKEKSNPESASSSMPSPPSLEGLNSKDRRKALRDYERKIQELKATNPHICKPSAVNDDSGGCNKLETEDNGVQNGETSKSMLQTLKEEARKIAKQNRKVEEGKKNPKKRSLDDTITPNTALQSSLHTPAGKKKKKIKDFSHLPPEERERRETQRRMQEEAAKRREEDAQNGFTANSKRHPLNSERRRANRRKPGKAGLMAARKKREKLTRDNPSSGSNRHVLASYNVEGFRKRKGFGNRFN